MTFSDALPVQFWLANCDTFNEKEVDGVFPRCFCQPFESADEIAIQFKDSPLQTRTLLVLNSLGEDLYEQDFSEVSSGLYQLSFTPQSIGITEDQINLNVVTKDNIQRIIAPSLWTNDTGGGGSTFDSKGDTTFTENSISSADNPRIFVYQPAIIPSGKTIVVTLTVFLGAPGAGISVVPLSVSCSLTDGSGNSVSSRSTPDTDQYTDLGTFTQREIITVNDGATSSRLYINVVISPFVVGSALFTIVVDVGEILYIPESSILAKSDCLDIKPTQPETILINYHNNRIFASLNSAVGTPDPEFNLRVPATFFEERFPEEQEVMQLSNSRSVQLNAQVRKQKLLKVKHMPFYMHLKLKLALVFQNVVIDNLQYLKEESYEIQQGNTRFPLRQATCWLTEKEYILRNIL